MRTIIVRVFGPAPGRRQGALQGVVEDVRTGATLPFRGEEELLRALAYATRSSGGSQTEELLAPPDLAPPTGTRPTAGPPAADSGGWDPRAAQPDEAATPVAAARRPPAP